MRKQREGIKDGQWGWRGWMTGLCVCRGECSVQVYRAWRDVTSEVRACERYLVVQLVGQETLSTRLLTRLAVLGRWLYVFVIAGGRERCGGDVALAL